MHRAVGAVGFATWGLLGGSARAADFDHAPFDALLRRHVELGYVDYDAFSRAPAFKKYLAAIGSFDPDGMPLGERLAFWINAYNAHTIQLVVSRGERDSLQSLKTDAGAAADAWSLPVARVASRVYTLNQIEHDVIRARFKDPRAHFALVCAAVGCPPLRSEAYVGARLEAQLEQQAREFLLSSPEKNHIDVEARLVRLSPIFDWYRQDFGGTDQAIGQYIARFLPEGAGKRLLVTGGYEIRWTGYDWSLNSRTHLAAGPVAVFERLKMLASEADVALLGRYALALRPVLSEHDRVLGRASPDFATRLRSPEPAERVGAVRLLIARDTVVLLKAMESASPGEARTLAKTALLEWRLLTRDSGTRPELDTLGAALEGLLDGVAVGRRVDVSASRSIAGRLLALFSGNGAAD